MKSERRSDQRETAGRNRRNRARGRRSARGRLARSARACSSRAASAPPWQGGTPRQDHQADRSQAEQRGDLLGILHRERRDQDGDRVGENDGRKAGNPSLVEREGQAHCNRSEGLRRQGERRSGSAASADAVHDKPDAETQTQPGEPRGYRPKGKRSSDARAGMEWRPASILREVGLNLYGEFGAGFRRRASAANGPADKTLLAPGCEVPRAGERLAFSPTIAGVSLVSNDQSISRSWSGRRRYEQAGERDFRPDANGRSCLPPPLRRVSVSGASDHLDVKRLLTVNERPASASLPLSRQRDAHRTQSASLRPRFFCIHSRPWRREMNSRSGAEPETNKAGCLFNVASVFGWCDPDPVA